MWNSPSNQETILCKQTFWTGMRKAVKYKVEDDIVIWIPIEGTQKTLYNQRKKQICACLESRRLGKGPTEYPGTAQSYKWALLNNENIWIEP